jgi:uncharacterized RDD family membrane protein YckC
MIKDREFPSQLETGQTPIGLASPWDRLAAAILDSTLLLPLVQLLQAPVEKGILEALLTDDGQGVSNYRLINLFIFISLFVIYHSLFTWWKGKTLGKMFFGLQVISYQGRMSLFSSWIRSLTIFIECLFAGIPLLSAFFHPLRRPLHDRVSDTLVISVKKPVGYPQRQESRKAQILFSISSVAWAFFLFAVLFVDVSTDDPKNFWQSPSCGESVASVNEDLERVVELKVIQEISDKCLYERAREALWDKEQRNSLALFAMALSLSEEPERAQEYYDSLCVEHGESFLCQLTQWLKDNEEGKTRSTSRFIESVDENFIPAFARVLLAPQLIQERKYQAVEKLLKPIREPGVLEPVVASLSFHSLVGQLKWDEAYWVYKTHNAVNDENLLYFLQLELMDAQMTTSQQIQLIDYFYPKINEMSSSRQPASTKGAIPNEILDIYKILGKRL